MIKSFSDQTTEDIFRGINSKYSRKIPKELHRIAARKLDLIDAADGLEDLRLPRGNRLEALAGDLKGKLSIRINNQWRIVFKWTGHDAEDVTIVDYH